VRIATPPSFSLVRAVLGHGWFDLPPFRWDDQGHVLRRVLRTGQGRIVPIEIREMASGTLALKLHLPEKGPGSCAADRAGAVRQVRHMLRLDEEFAEFHAVCRGIEGFGWAADAGAGRLLRAPDLYEDLVKMICTTNCTWALTRVMVGALVEGLGEEPTICPASFAGARAFPTAEAMAKAPGRFYEKEAKAGYRGPYLKELAERVAAGKLDPSRWLDPGMPLETVRAEIISVKGAGRYVADNMLKLVGRYEGLGLDTWCRRKFSEIHHRGRSVKDRTIERFYAPFGRWCGLALWCDITRDWFTEDGMPAPLRLRQQKY
jgi:N-glycosylase/DNA lyase